MSKNFRKQTAVVTEAVQKFASFGKNNTVFCILCNKHEYHVLTNADNDERTKGNRAENIINALVANRELFNRVMRVVKPVERFYAREQKRELRKIFQPIND